MNDVPSTPVARGGWMLIGLTSINIVIQLIVAGIVKYSTQVAWTTLWGGIVVEWGAICCLGGDSSTLSIGDCLCVVGATLPMYCSFVGLLW